jgi:hypothetical protein
VRARAWTLRRARLARSAADSRSLRTPPGLAGASPAGEPLSVSARPLVMAVVIANRAAPEQGRGDPKSSTEGALAPGRARILQAISRWATSGVSRGPDDPCTPPSLMAVSARFGGTASDRPGFLLP